MGSSTARGRDGRSDGVMVAIGVFNLVSALAVWLVLRLTEPRSGAD